jgi:hypothetical protein
VVLDDLDPELHGRPLGIPAGVLRETTVGRTVPLALSFSKVRSNKRIGTSGGARSDDQLEECSTTSPTRSSNEAARVTVPLGRCNNHTSCPPRAAEGDAGDRLPQRHLAPACTGYGRVPPRVERNRLCRGTKCSNRLPLGRGSFRSAARLGRRSGRPQGRRDCGNGQPRCGARGEECNLDDRDRLHGCQRPGWERAGRQSRPAG